MYEEEKIRREERYSKVRKHRPLFIMTLIATLVYIGWRIFFTLPTRYGVVALLFGILLLAAECASAYLAVLNYANLSKYAPLEVPDIPREWYPDVDIFIATHNETPDLLFNTVNACRFLDYPDRSKIHIHLCDDNNRPEMAKLAADLEVSYWGLSGNKYAKGGNLNNAMRQTFSPITVTLDADMIPRHEFLMRTVPLFYLHKLKKVENGSWIERAPEEIDPDYKVGFIQTPQGFYNPDLFQYNLYSEGRIPNEQDWFFQELNASRSSSNSVIYAGSNTLISREALEDVEYIAVDTITEDILTGLRMQKLGYHCYGTGEVLVQGQAPVTIRTLLNQRIRWARGCVDALHQEPVFSSGVLSPVQKISYIGNLIYWWMYASRLMYLAAPILAVLFNLVIVQTETWQVVVFGLPYYFLLNRSLRVMSGDVWNQHWSNVSDTILFPYLIGPILAEQLGIKQKKFKVTDKNVSRTRSRATLVFGITHIVLAVGMVASIIVIINKSIMTGTIYSPIILYWLIIGTKNLLFAIFFMYGRQNNRLASRFYFSEPITVKTRDNKWQTVTADVSETGMAFYLDNPEYIDSNEKITITFNYRGTEVDIRARVVHVVQAGNRWKYSVLNEPLTDNARCYYMEYVYDRAHSLPTRLDPSISILDDFNLMLAKRVKSVMPSNRMLPRAKINMPFAAPSGVEGTICDFNYKYAVVRFQTMPDNDETVAIDVVPGFSLVLKPLKDSGEEILCEVMNFDEVATSAQIPAILTRLINMSPKEKAALAAKS